MTADGPAAAGGPEVPLVSVVIPVRNGGSVIAGQLAALSRQDFPGRWEVVVGDNGSTDDTRAVVEAWRGRLPALTVVDTSGRRGVNFARNGAARRARGGVLLFADADDEVCSSWVSAMVEVLARSDLATGPSVLFDDRGRGLGVASPHEPSTSLEFLPFARGSNLGVRREVFDRVGGFDEDWPFLGGDDIDFCWRTLLAGAELGFSEDVVVRYRQPATVRRALLKQFGYGRGSVMLSDRYRAAGARAWRWRDSLRDGAALVRDSPCLLSRSRRLDWVKRLGWATGVAVGQFQSDH